MSQDTTQASSWAEQVKKVVADRAYTLNYEDGVQSRFMPPKVEQGSHTIEVLMETTHMGHPFDLQWFVSCAEDPGSTIQFSVVAPPAEGGVLWKDSYRSLERLYADAQSLPTFIRGYFVGLAAGRAAATPAAPTATE